MWFKVYYNFYLACLSGWCAYIQRNKKETIVWIQCRLVYLLFKRNKTSKLHQTFCCLKCILLDVTDNTSNKTFTSALNESHDKWKGQIAEKTFGKCIQIQVYISSEHDIRNGNKILLKTYNFLLRNGKVLMALLASFMSFCTKYNAIKLFMRRWCLSVIRPVFHFWNYPINLAYIRCLFVKNKAQAVGQISFWPWALLDVL
jgi:prophage maintenance system killer protein